MLCCWWCFRLWHLHLRNICRFSALTVPCRVPMAKVTAGNLVLVEGLDALISKTATVVGRYLEEEVHVFRPLAFQDRRCGSQQCQRCMQGQGAQQGSGLKVFSLETRLNNHLLAKLVDIDFWLFHQLVIGGQTTPPVQVLMSAMCATLTIFAEGACWIDVLCCGVI